MFDRAIHKGPGDWYSLPYAHWHQGVAQHHSVSTCRWPQCSESISEHHGVVILISAEHVGPMSMVAALPALVEQPLADLLLGRSELVFGSCLHSGRPLVSDGSFSAEMAEAAPLAVVTDALANGTVSGDVGDVERPSTDPRALSSQLALESVPSGHKVAAVGPRKRPS